MTDAPIPTVEEAQAERMRRHIGLMTEDELAAVLGLMPATLTVWRSTGSGPAYVKLGKNVFYRPVDVARWAAENLVDPVAKSAPKGLDSALEHAA